MCSPSRATLFTGRYPRRARRDADADRRPTCGPTRATLPDTVRTMAGSLRSGAAPRGRLLKQFARGAAPPRPERRRRARARPDTPSLRVAAPRDRLRGRLQGQVAPHPPERREGGIGELLGGWLPADADGSPRVRVRRLGGPPDAGENAKAENFGGGNAGEGEGWDEVYIAPGRALARPRARSRSRSASSSRSSTRTTCSATRPPIEAGGYSPERVPRARGRAAADRRRGPARQARRPRADADGDDRLPRAARDRRMQSSTTSTSTPTCIG